MDYSHRAVFGVSSPPMSGFYAFPEMFSDQTYMFLARVCPFGLHFGLILDFCKGANS